VVLPLAFLAVFFAWPVIGLVARGFVGDDGFSLNGVSDVLSSPRTWRIIGQTLTLAVAGTVVSVLLGVPGAYLLYRCRFPGRGFVRALVSVPFVLPTVVVGVAFGSLFATSGPLGWLGLHNYMYIWHHTGGPFTVDLIADNFADIYLRGVQKR